MPKKKRFAALISDIDVEQYEWPIPRVEALCGTKISEIIPVPKTDLDRFLDMEMRTRNKGREPSTCRELFQLEEIMRSRVAMPWLLGARSTCLILEQVRERQGTLGFDASVRILSSERRLVERLRLYGEVKTACLMTPYEEVLEIPKEVVG